MKEKNEIKVCTQKKNSIEAYAYSTIKEKQHEQTFFLFIYLPIYSYHVLYISMTATIHINIHIYLMGQNDGGIMNRIYSQVIHKIKNALNAPPYCF